MKTQAAHEYSNEMGVYLLLGLEEIIGHPQLDAVLAASKVAHAWSDTAQPKKMAYADLTSIQESLQHLYGVQGGLGVAFRAGRASYRHLFGQYGNMIGLTDTDYRFLPASLRLKFGLKILADLMTRIGAEIVTVSEEEKYWFWSTCNCPLCWKRVSPVPICQFTAGLLQEFTSWASRGRVHTVAEVECQAMGAQACQVRIDKKAMD